MEIKNVKRFAIFAFSELGDLEFTTNDYDAAEAMYTKYANKHEFRSVQWVNNLTGEIYRHRDIELRDGGFYRTEWQALPF